MKSNVDKYVDWDEDLGFPESKEGVINVSWFEDRTLYEPEYTKKQFSEYLSNQYYILRALRRILKKKHMEVHRAQYNFKENQNIKDSLMFYEGYKKALHDIYKIIPRPNGD